MDGTVRRRPVLVRNVPAPGTPASALAVLLASEVVSQAVETAPAAVRLALPVWRGDVQAAGFRWFEIGGRDRVTGC